MQFADIAFTYLSATLGCVFEKYTLFNGANCSHNQKKAERKKYYLYPLYPTPVPRELQKP